MNIFIILLLLGIGIVVLFCGYSKNYTDDYRIVKELSPSMNNNGVTKYYRYKIQQEYSTTFNGKYQWSDVTSMYLHAYGESEMTVHFSNAAEARGYLEMLKNPIGAEVVEIIK